MKTVLSFTIFLVLELNLVYSQVSINSDGTLPDSSSMLEVKSSVSGFLIPRMKFTQRDLILNSIEGLMVFYTKLWYRWFDYIYLKAAWRNFQWPTGKQKMIPVILSWVAPGEFLPSRNGIM